ncbi:hypothetical protein M405DRAFT_443997 [Rhizopogon salebrosus TDB-379]|nr:hypothetical protein M405DRAFT_443997 [Rhizopogon salebrosus TDB-379]
MDDVNAFFAEQEQRMNLPDEDVDEYIRARLEDLRKKKTEDSNHASDRAICAQSQRTENSREADASWHSSGLFHTSAIEAMTSEQRILEEGVLRPCVLFTSHVVIAN